MYGWRQHIGRSGIFRWLLIAWAVVLGLMSSGLLVWVLMRLAVLALLVALPVVAIGAGTRAVGKWRRRREAERRGHELVEVRRAQQVAGD